MSKKIHSPVLDPKLFYGPIVSWDFRFSVQKMDGKYGFYYELTFQNGVTKKQSRSGFSTKKEAEKGKEKIIELLSQKKFIPYRYSPKEFYDFYVYHVLLEEKKMPYNTYMAYRNIIYNYFLPAWGSIWMDQIDQKTAQKALSCIPYERVVDNAYSLMRNSFAYAKKNNIMALTPAENAIYLEKKKRKRKKENTQKKREPVILSTHQASYVLLKCKEYYPDIYMTILFCFTTGVRISESIAITYDAIDFEKREVEISYQLGRNIKNNGFEDKTLCTQPVPLKTQKSKRSIPVPDFVLDEVLVKKQKAKGCYISCHPDGKPFNSAYVRKRFTKLLEQLKFPHMGMHDIRRTYSTLLAEDGISMKGISECMGHVSAEFTEKIYVKKEQPIYPVPEELTTFIKSVLPEERIVYPFLISQKFMNEVLPVKKC